MTTITPTKFKETEIGLIPEEWAVKSLGDVLEITSSKRIFMSEYVDVGVPFYRGKEIIEKANGNRDISTPLFISEQRFSEITEKFGAPKEGDILMSSVGTLGVSYQVGKDEKFYFKDGNLTWFRNYRDGVCPEYIQYWLKSPAGQRSILSGAIGSTQPALTIDGLKKILLAIPTVGEQKQISEIVSSLDDKIELNRKINANLEKLAGSLFKKWFVDIGDGLPDAETKFLSDVIAESVNGDWGKEQEDEEFSKKVLCVRGADISELKDGGMGKLPLRFIKERNFESKRLRHGDIVFEISGGSPTQSTGRCVLVTNDLLSRFESPLICSNFCRVVRLKELDRVGFYYVLFNEIYNRNVFFQYENGTSGIKNLDLASFFKTTKLHFSTKKALEFSLFFSDLFKNIQDSGTQSRNLSNIRDSLLPRLMSGKIRV